MINGLTFILIYMPPKKIKHRKCKVCDYMRLHPKATYNRRLIDGESVSKVAKDFGCCYNTMARHAGLIPEKDGTQKAHYMNWQMERSKRVREERAMLDVAKCQKEIYEKSMKAVNMALGEIATPETANLSVVGSCAMPAVKVIEIMSKATRNDNDDVPGIEKALAAIKEAHDGEGN